MGLAEDYGSTSPCGAYNHFEMAATLEGCPHCRASGSKRYLVRKGMFDAFWAEYSGGVCGPDSHRRIIDGLIGAMAWVSEHPIEPTGDQSMRLRDVAKEVSGRYGMTVPTGASEAAVVIAWQRMMFIAPEPNPAVQTAIRAVQGCILTQEDADAIKEYVQQCVGGQSR